MSRIIPLLCKKNVIYFAVKIFPLLHRLPTNMRIGNISLFLFILLTVLCNIRLSQGFRRGFPGRGGFRGFGGRRGFGGGFRRGFYGRRRFYGGGGAFYRGGGGGFYGGFGGGFVAPVPLPVPVSVVSYDYYDY